MIQRVQSLYLLIGILMIAAVFLFDAAWPGGYTDVPPWLPGALFATAAISVTLGGWAILLYRDRKRQRDVVLYAQVATIVMIAVFLFGLYDIGQLTPVLGGPDAPWKLIAIVLPFFAYLFFYMARKAIERDIKLVRSMDRLR